MAARWEDEEFDAGFAEPKASTKDPRFKHFALFIAVRLDSSTA